jgi:hypothetical protein
VINGGSRIHTAEGVDFQAIRDRVKSGIKAAMERGALNKLEGRIVNISYLENVTIDEEPDIQSGNPSSADSESETLPAWAWGIIGAGSCMFLVMLGFLCARRRREDKGSDEMTPLGSQGVDYIPPPSSDHDNPYYDQVPLPQDSTEPLPQDYTPQYSFPSGPNEPEYSPPPALDETSGDEDDETQEHRNS